MYVVGGKVGKVGQLTRQNTKLGGDSESSWEDLGCCRWFKS